MNLFTKPNKKKTTTASNIPLIKLLAMKFAKSRSVIELPSALTVKIYMNLTNTTNETKAVPIRLISTKIK